MSSSDRNPFEPPVAAALGRSAARAPLADRPRRLVGFLVDVLVGFLPLVIAAPLLVLTGGLDLTGDPTPATLVVGGLASLAMLGVAVMQWQLIVERGQSVGKIVTGTRIVRMDGREVDFLHGVVLRNWVVGLFAGMCNVAGVGFVITVLDGLLILRADRRCVHDHVADTEVVEASGVAWDAADPGGGR